jgi:L-threonylcarbamoyladenylate synthase
LTVVTGDVERGADALRRGLLVAFPTETVYGLGADASRSGAVARIFTAKGRPAGHPLIVHVARSGDVEGWVDVEPLVRAQIQQLADAFWPGPLTIVARRSARAAPEAVGGRSTIGIRVPSHPVALALLEQFGGGVAAPSATRFGRVSPTTAAHVLDDLGDRVDVVVDGGPTEVGVESTIVELVGGPPVLLRPGGVARAQLEAVLGGPVAASAGESRAPGMLRSHYAPEAAVELATIEVVAGLGPEVGADVGVIAPGEVAHVPSWRLPADAGGYASRLYAALREADRAGVRRLLVVPPADGPLIEAVLDRLSKAAAPRPAP